jgi:hypothetical protein
LGIVGILVGLVVSWYFYEKSIQLRSPVFVVDFFPSTIYDAKRELRLPFKVFGNDGQQLDKSVHVARHVLLNSGKYPIVSSDILTPLLVTIRDDDSEILSVSVSEQSRRIVSCSVKQEGKKSFSISFKILEEQDGCSFKLFYSGWRFPKHDVTADIVGVRKMPVLNDMRDKMKYQEILPVSGRPAVA